jgi:hypothetical protein
MAARTALAILAAATIPSLACAAPRLDSVSVKPNPVPLQGGKAGDVVIAVTIERPTPLDLRCEALVDPGDGGRTLHMSWSIGDARTRTARYEYKKAGTYRLKVAGTGQNACTGVRELTVNVGGAPAPRGVRGPSCPSGWTLVEDSVKGVRYTCRPRPPGQPLRCAEGTTYFSERGEIGCR